MGVGVGRCVWVWVGVGGYGVEVRGVVQVVWVGMVFGWVGGCRWGWV